MKSLSRFVPILVWLPSYSRELLTRDLSAGITTAVMLVPQAMAYSLLAGLPPVIGLYASIVPLVLYAVFGTSRQLAVGPVAMVSLLVASGVGALAPSGSAEYVTYAVLLALMVGAIQLLMGAGRLGFLTNFLSHPVLSGFTSAAALIIGFSQLGQFFGVKLERSHYIHDTLIGLVRKAEAIHGYTLAIGAASVALLVLLKRIDKRFPSALVAVAGGTVAVWALGLAEKGVSVVGEIPPGLPSPELPSLDVGAAGALLPTAMTIALVGFMESIAVAKAFARRNGYDVDANQEFVGLGIANLGGALFQAYPVTGGFSRTAVNAEAGAKTGLAAIVTAAVVAITLLFLTPLFYYLPKAVLAAIIMTAVFGLVDFREVKHLWRVKRSDLVLLLLTFVATLSLGIDNGILAGVGASLVWFVVRTTRPHFAVLGRLPGTRTYRNTARHPDAEVDPSLLVIRMDAQFYFGNMSFLRQALRKLEAEQVGPLRAVIIDGSSINQLDSSADAALHEVRDDLACRDVALYFAGVKGPVLDVMKRSGFYEKLGADHFFFDVADACDAAHQHAVSAPPAPTQASGADRTRRVAETPRPAATAGV